MKSDFINNTTVSFSNISQEFMCHFQEFMGRFTHAWYRAPGPTQSRSDDHGLNYNICNMERFIQGVIELFIPAHPNDASCKSGA